VKKNHLEKQCGVLCLKTVKGVALISSLLTLLHGLYFPVYFLWLGVLALVGFSEFVLPPLDVLLFIILDTVVYLILAVGMLRGRKSFFVYSIVWAVWGALLSTVAVSYGGHAEYALNLLSFLIVFCSTYYYANTNTANPDISKAVGTIAGILALAQGIIIAIALAIPLAGPMAEANPSQTFFSDPTFWLLLVTGVIYLFLGIGMVKSRSDFFTFAIFWTLVESALAVAYSPIMNTHLNIISILITTSATYSYFSRKRS